MANIPIRDIPLSGTPDASSYIVFDNGQMRKGTVGSMADSIRPLASQAEAQAGSNNTKTMTPLRVKESIESEVGSSVQAYGVDLTAIEALSGTGIPRREGDGDWAISDTISITEGGTGAITAPAARVNLGIDKRTAVGDTNYTILSTDVIVATTAAFTAPRTWTLPSAAACNPGQRIQVIDEIAAISGANNLTVQRAGSDTVSGSTSILLSTPRDGQWFETDGASKWSLVVPNSRFVNTRYSPTSAGVNVTGAADRTVHDKLYETVAITDFFLAVDIDYTNALQRAMNVALTKNIKVTIPSGDFTISALVSVATENNLVIEGAGKDASRLIYTGSTGLIQYGLPSIGWTKAIAGQRQFFSVRSLRVVWRGTGGNAITAYFPYSPSSQFSNCAFVDLNISPDNPNDLTKFMNCGIYIYCGWYPQIQRCEINQPNGKLSGSAIQLDGLSPGCVIQACHGWGWDKAVNLTSMSFQGFTGAILTGVFVYGEIVTGGTSGAQGRLARAGAYGSATVVVVPIAGTFANAETITGGTSGASLTNITKVTIYQSQEGTYVTQSEFILNNHGFYSNQNSAVVAEGIGYWLDNTHFSSYVSNVYGRYSGQWDIQGLIMFGLANNAVDIDIDNGNIAIITGNQFNADTFTGRTAIKIAATAFTRAIIEHNHIENRNVGIALGNLTLSNYPSRNQFYNNTTNITVGGSASFVGPPTFAAYNSASQTGVAAATPTKITMTTENFDLGGYYDSANSKWTPPPGRVQISGAATVIAGVAAGATLAVQLWKNGSYYRSLGGGSVPTNIISGATGAIVDIANGSDYYELYFYADGAGTKTIAAGPISTYFCGAVL